MNVLYNGVGKEIIGPLFVSKSIPQRWTIRIICIWLFLHLPFDNINSLFLIFYTQIFKFPLAIMETLLNILLPNSGILF